MDDFIWGLLLAGAAYFFATHWEEIIDSLSDFFRNIAYELGIDVGQLVNSFQSILQAFNNSVAQLVTKIYLRDAYGRSIVRTEVKEVDYDEIPKNLRQYVMQGNAVDVTNDVRQVLIQQL
ncbi:MAG: hypothetical protein MJ048_06060 [Acidaminococcaceae bacterium]|nr:hypothetical protein [Acidaminococcaceae bacterium]